MNQNNTLVAVYGRHLSPRRLFVKAIKKKLRLSNLDAFYLKPIYFQEMDQVFAHHLSSNDSLAKEFFEEAIKGELENRCHLGLSRSLMESEDRVIIVDNYIESLKLWDTMLYGKDSQNETALKELEARYPKANVSILVDNSTIPLSMNKEEDSSIEVIERKVQVFYQKIARENGWLIIKNEKDIPKIILSISMMANKKGKFEVPQTNEAWSD